MLDPYQIRSVNVTVLFSPFRNREKSRGT